VLAACALEGQRNRRRGQRFWFDWVRDEALDQLALRADDIDRVAAALADRGALDQADLVDILGAQTPLRQMTEPS
jgi:hypothetical protein